ncbi:SAM-dependent methyltransferase [Streptomyces sp. NPDC047002]|uniref:SAM-dependent methyltransferase n=1 Tax=Streptomyces sp. NPDC047002 TaxID=3155475 RepID=UPI0034549B00
MSGTADWMRADGARERVDLKAHQPHPARVYDFLLGGKTHYPADREAGERTLANVPTAAVTAREGRAFMHRSVRHLAAEAGVRQFLDIGTGIPTSPNLHEIAQGIAPESRVVYTDNDAIVLAHSRALHTGTPEGRTAYIQADATDPEGILGDPLLRETLDLARPTALILSLLLHWLPDDADAYGIVRTLVGALAPGSYLMIAHVADDIFPTEQVGAVARDFRDSGGQMNPRNRAEVARFFEGMALVEPGIVVPQRWRPDTPPVEVGAPGAGPGDGDVPVWVGLARI